MPLPGGGFVRVKTQTIPVDKLPARPRRPRPASRPQVQRASAIPFVQVGGRRIPLWQPIDDSGRELPKNITEEERRAVQLARIKAANQRAANRDQGNVVTNYIGETTSNLARQTGEFISGLPVAVAAPIIGTARDAFTATNPISLTYADKQEGRQATRRLVTRPAQFAGDTGEQIVGLAKEFVKNPLGTFRERPLEVILTFMGGKSVVGTGAGAGSRAAGRLGRGVRDVKAEGGIRQARDARRKRPTTPPPGQGAKFRSASAAVTERDLAAFQTNLGRRMFRASQALADFGSKSVAEGSRRYRPPRVVEPTIRDEVEIDGRVARPKGPVVVPRRPRSADPITRGTQRLVYEPIARRLGIQPSYRSLARKDASATGFQIIEDTSKVVGAVAAPYVRATRALSATGRKDGLPASEIALASELRDIVVSGRAQPIRGSRRYGVEQEIANVRRSLSEPGLTRKQRRAYESRLERLQAIPDEWLDPETRPQRIQRFIDTAIPLYEGAGAQKLAAGIITPDAADFSRVRPLIQALGGRSAQAARADAKGDRAAVKAINDEAVSRSTRVSAARARLSEIEAEARAITATGARVPKSLRREEARARSEVKAAEAFAKDKMYVGYDDAELASLSPGTYVPQRRMVEERQGFVRSVTGGRPLSQRAGDAIRGMVRSSTRMAPQRERYNAGINYERGDIGATPNLPITAYTEATDAVIRSQGAAGLVDRWALRDAESGKLITGPEAERLVESNPGDFTLITRAQLAKISTASIDTPAGARLAQAIDESDLPNAKTKYVLPKSVYEGWANALGPANTAVGRGYDYLISLWKGNVLALSPRWYIINMVGMWGQFALGAGADLQAIAMARNPALLMSLPGRIAWRGLPEEMGEFARRSSGLPSRGVYQRIIYKGFEINEMFESVPRRAMFWHAAKQGLREAEIIGPGPVSEARLAAAWLDVARSAARGDEDANRIVDEAILVTERFMGNYSRYNRGEKMVLRRVFPFYGWMRSIHRLAFALPFKHPKRAALLGIGSMMAYELYGMEVSDSAYNRPGAIRWGGGMLTQTGPANIFDSLRDSKDFVTSFGERIQTSTDNPQSFFGRTAVDLLRFGARNAGPVVGELFASTTGATAAGVPLRFSPGAQGRFDTGVGPVVSADPGTGADRYDRQETDLLERVIRAFTPQNATLRRMLAGGEPYEDASNLQLLGYAVSGRDDPAATARLVAPDPRVPPSVPRDSLAFATGLLGFPTTRVNREGVARQAIKSKNRLRDAQRRQRRALKRAENKARRQQQGG